MLANFCSTIIAGFRIANTYSGYPRVTFCINSYGRVKCELSSVT